MTKLLRKEKLYNSKKKNLVKKIQGTEQQPSLNPKKNLQANRTLCPLQTHISTLGFI